MGEQIQPGQGPAAAKIKGFRFSNDNRSKWANISQAGRHFELHC